MKYRREGSRVFVRLEIGDKVHESLAALASREGIGGGFVNALGALSHVELGYYDLERREYARRTVHGEVELASANGTMSMVEGKPQLHLHAVVSDRQCQTFGGHVFAATTAATVEILIQVSDAPIEKTPDERTGLNLWRV